MSDRWASYHESRPRVAPGWSFDAIVGPSALGGSNGMAIAPDGRLHVTQVFGSQVTAIDPDTGRHELFSPLGSGIVGPDDGFFGADGTFFATEPLIGRVSARQPDGSYRIVRDGLPAANGITMDHDRRRLFVDEFRPGGRLLELDPHGDGEPRVLLEELDGPNALSMGPDGRLYFPQVFANQIWAYDLDTGRSELIVDDLDVPTAVKFDSRGRIVTSESGGGRITAISLDDGRRETLAEVPRGIDNVSVGDGDRIFVSHYVDGRVAEETGGRSRVLSEPGLLGPFGLWPGDDGRLLVADGLSVAAVDHHGTVERVLKLLIELHTLAIGVCQLDGDIVVLSATGEVLRYRPGSAGPEVVVAGLAQPTAVAPDGSGGLLVAERAGGRLTRIRPDGSTVPVAEGLRSPGAVSGDPSGEVWLTQGDGGGLLALDPDGGRRAIDGFVDAQGLTVSGGIVLVADVGRRELVAVDVATSRREVVVADAPIGPAAPGFVPSAFCSLCGDGRGGAYVGANGDGSIRHLRRR